MVTVLIADALGLGALSVAIIGIVLVGSVIFLSSCNGQRETPGLQRLNAVSAPSGNSVVTADDVRRAEYAARQERARRELLESLPQFKASLAGRMEKLNALMASLNAIVRLLDGIEPGSETEERLLVDAAETCDKISSVLR